MTKLPVILICGLALVSAVRAEDQDQNKKNKGKPANVPKGQFTPHNDIKIGNKSQFRNYDKTTNVNKTFDVNKTTNINKTITLKKNVTLNKNFTFQKQHFDLRTNVVNPKYKAVAFNQNFKIAGAYNWKGPKYAVFVNYHPLWHDQWWWQSHHSHLVFIFGGWYYWDNNYWYPAWGYAPDSVYYYDGPIYASSPEEDPGQVVANVQAALRQGGYYHGDVDGILGPQTRAALADYQVAQGLEPTGSVDEPTLESLGMV